MSVKKLFESLRKVNENEDSEWIEKSGLAPSKNIPWSTTDGVSNYVDWTGDIEELSDNDINAAKEWVKDNFGVEPKLSKYPYLGFERIVAEFPYEGHNIILYGLDAANDYGSAEVRIDDEFYDDLNLESIIDTVKGNENEEPISDKNNNKVITAMKLALMNKGYSSVEYLSLGHEVLVKKDGDSIKMVTLDKEDDNHVLVSINLNGSESYDLDTFRKTVLPTL